VDRGKTTKPGAPRLRAVRSERRVPRSVFVGDAMNLELIKLAVDFQDLSAADERAASSKLELLRQTTNVDAVCLVLFNNEGAKARQVISAVAAESRIKPERLLELRLDALPWLAARLGHLRLLELLDTSISDPETEAEGELLHHCGISAVTLIGFSARGLRAGFLALCCDDPLESWDVSLHLLLKLLGSSYATALERQRVERDLEALRERQALVLIAANDGMWDFDVPSGKTYFSPRWKKMLGYAEDDFEDSVPDWRVLVHPDDYTQVQASIREHLEGKTDMFESVHRLRHKNGEWRWVMSRAKALPDSKGKLKRLVGVELDITDRKRYEEALFREKESAQITLHSIGDGVITTNAGSVVEYLNPTAEELTGWKLEDAQGRTIDDIFRAFHEETCEPLENPLAVAIRRRRAAKSIRPTLLIRRDGNELYIESTAAPIRDGSGEVTGGVLVFHDVSESRELNRRLSYQASHDILTGLVNRREFESRLERALKSAKAGEGNYAICYLDLDQFKVINDSCGHTAGDALLGQLGALLKSKIRWRDTLARLGGDEFGVLMECESLSEAMTLADSLREAVHAFRFNWDDRSFRLGASVGVVPISRDSEDVTTVLSAADSACAAAKEAGRNRVHAYEMNDNELMRRRREMQWAARISTALEESRFELFRQVIMPLQSADEGAHYELLLRMRDEHGNLISPELFIAAAERYGKTTDIDRWVIQNALRWLMQDSRERARLALCSINLSGQSLADDKFLPFVMDELRRSGIDARCICFEITETAAIASFSQANRFINALRELGCKFALDDFGTGLSSFAYLKHFPVDFLKIDGSFVKEMLHDPIDREMVRAINEIGHLTGKRTIAEFAESEEIIEMLRTMNVDYAQGYAISEPRRLNDPRG
jgi:diguanylate cyclase (GGDEF)-like protein/PAS domain S-box-containing protein